MRAGSPGGRGWQLGWALPQPPPTRLQFQALPTSVAADQCSTVSRGCHQAALQLPCQVLPLQAIPAAAKAPATAPFELPPLPYAMVRTAKAVVPANQLQLSATRLGSFQRAASLKLCRSCCALCRTLSSRSCPRHVGQGRQPAIGDIFNNKEQRSGTVGTVGQQLGRLGQWGGY